jgi:hypothetical protein
MICLKLKMGKSIMLLILTKYKYDILLCAILIILFVIIYLSIEDDETDYLS